MKELDVHTAMVKAAEDAGGFGLKMNNRFKVGVADLLIKLPIFAPTIIEVKMSGAKDIDQHGKFRVDLTPHQCRFLREYRAAGGVSGWLVVCKMKKPFGSFRMATSTYLPEKDGSFDMRGSDGVRYLTRLRGDPWPIGDIVAALIQMKGYASAGK